MDISKRLFFTNAVYYFIGIVGGGLINFFSIPLIIEKYGVEEYGDYSLIQNIILIIISFGSGWLNQNILRFNDGSQIFKWNIISSFYLSLLPLAILSFFVLLVLKYNSVIAVISALTVAVGGLTAIMNTFYQSNLNAKKNVLFDLLRVLGFVVCVYLFSTFNENEDSVLFLIISFFISYVIAFVLKLRNDFFKLLRVFKILVRFLQVGSLKLFLERNRRYFDYGWPLSLWFTVSSLLNVGDRYIINVFLPKSELGTYSAVYDLLYKGVSISFTPILAAGYPIISKYYNNKEKVKAYSFLKKLVVVELVILIVAIIISIEFDSLFLEYVVRIPYSPRIANLVPLILASAIIWQIAMLVHKPLELKMKTRIMLVFVVLSLIVNIILNIVFVPKYGLVAAAWSSMVSVFVYLILNLVYIFKNRAWIM